MITSISPKLTFSDARQELPVMLQDHEMGRNRSTKSWDLLRHLLFHTSPTSWVDDGRWSCSQRSCPSSSYVKLCQVPVYTVGSSFGFFALHLPSKRPPLSATRMRAVNLDISWRRRFDSQGSRSRATPWCFDPWGQRSIVGVSDTPNTTFVN